MKKESRHVWALLLAAALTPAGMITSLAAERTISSVTIRIDSEPVSYTHLAVRDLELITGQKAVTTKAKKSVANFKIREGMAIGCKVTLRGEKMYEFADRLINLALPRVRDFRGVNPNACLLYTSRCV